MIIYQKIYDNRSLFFNGHVSDILHTSLQENPVTPKISQITLQKKPWKPALSLTPKHFPFSPCTKRIHPTRILSSMVDVCMSVVKSLQKSNSFNFMQLSHEIWQIDPKTRWWFQRCVIFTLEKWLIIWLIDLIDGLVQPPTRKSLRPGLWEFEYFDYGRCFAATNGLSLLGGAWNRKDARDLFLGFYYGAVARSLYLS